MEIVKPYAELWVQSDMESHIARCAQLCYASEKNIDNKEAWLDTKWKNGHKSIFRHGTHYYAIPLTQFTEFLEKFFYKNPYCGIYKNDEYAFISINDQTYRENTWFHHLFRYSTNELGIKSFINNKEDLYGITNILRKTVLVQTQISTSRELNRTSPNNICEQSTRYCNFTQEKFNGEVKLCQPHWMNILGHGVSSCIMWLDGHDIIVADSNRKPFEKITPNSKNTIIVNIDKYENCIYDYLISTIFSSEKYTTLVDKGMIAQDARGALPIDANTRCVYTYRIEEWKHILDLRYYGTTGKPHPNARIAADKIRKAINPSLPEFEDASWSEPYFPEDVKLSL